MSEIQSNSEKIQRNPNQLTDANIEELVSLGKKIILGLSCNANGDDFPCRSDRIQVINDMIQYLKIHDLLVIEKES